MENQIRLTVPEYTENAPVELVKNGNQLIVQIRLMNGSVVLLDAAALVKEIGTGVSLLSVKETVAKMIAAGA